MRKNSDRSQQTRFRGLLGSGLVVLLSTGAFFACVGDDPTADGNNGGDDASSAGDTLLASDGSSEATTGPATAKTADVTVYVGNVTTLDATGSTPTGATFAWTLKSVPAASKVTIASVQNAMSAKPSFTPDVPGDYGLQVSVSAGAAPSTATATVHAAPGKLFYVSSKALSGSKTNTEMHFTHTDGTGDVAITCPVVASSTQLVFGKLIANGAVHWFEGAPADDAKVAFGYADNLPDGGFSTYIATGSGASRCDGLHLVGHVDVVNDTVAVQPPRGVQLSPSGARVAYVRSTEDDGISRVVTIGFDGSNLHRFESVAFSGGVESGPPSYIVTPRWIDETHLAWVELTSLTTWRVMTATDVAGPSPNIYMTCNATTASVGAGQQADIIEFEMLGDGSVLAVSDGSADASAGLVLNVLRPNAATKQCELVHELATASSADFALSPDKKTVAFLKTNASNLFTLSTVPVDGSKPPTAVGGAPDGGATEGNGPRWAAGGAWLEWGQTGASIGNIAPDNVVAVAAAGGDLSRVALPDASTDSAYAAGNSCTIAHAASSNGAGFAGIGIGIAFALRRRKRART